MSHFHSILKANTPDAKKLIRVYRKNIGPMYRAINRWLNIIDDAVMYGVVQQMILGKKPARIKKFHYIPKDDLEWELMNYRVKRYLSETRKIEKAKSPFTDITTKIVDWHSLRMKGDKLIGRMYLNVYGQAMGQAGQIAKFPIRFDVVNQRAVKWSADHAPVLITNIVDGVRSNVQEIITNGIAEGKSIPKIGKEIREIGGVGLNSPQMKALNNYQARLLESGLSSEKTAEKVQKKYRQYHKYRAEMIARTETARAVSAGTLEGYKEAGVEKIKFEAAGDPCEVCLGYDGNTYSRAEGDGLIPVHQNCRCTWVPIIESIKVPTEMDT